MIWYINLSTLNQLIYLIYIFYNHSQVKLHSIQYILYYEFLAPPPLTTSVALFMNESDAQDALVCMVSMACKHVYVKIHVVLFFKHCLICSRVQFHIQRIRFIYILNSGSTNMDTLIVTVIFKVQYIAVCKYFNGFTATHRG